MKQEEFLIVLSVYLLIIAVGHWGPGLIKAVPTAWKMRLAQEESLSGAARVEPAADSSPAQKPTYSNVVFLKPLTRGLAVQKPKTAGFFRNGTPSPKAVVIDLREKQARGEVPPSSAKPESLNEHWKG